MYNLDTKRFNDFMKVMFKVMLDDNISRETFFSYYDVLHEVLTACYKYDKTISDDAYHYFRHQMWGMKNSYKIMYGIEFHIKGDRKIKLF